ncbi:hypothetical protein LTR97_002076 [Elasticomyces elasticus]|uniref:Uncharacterized protein n=1 Tax=Elasticomyces elasticus TaxID=574655 RepID=A0AAN7WH31_9PEZI|nr:hypothetical protein LTR97_002076 [Elasticomyces elasticus]
MAALRVLRSSPVRHHKHEERIVLRTPADIFLSVPGAVKHCCQNTLTAQWTKKLPFIQRQPPAELAADAVLSAINSLDDIETAEWTVIDFCSGAGGPIPFIETLVNDSRRLEGKKPIQFRLSDLHPNIDAWMKHAALSENLSFVPQPVDASYPPFVTRIMDDLQHESFSPSQEGTRKYLRVIANVHEHGRFSVISATTTGDKAAALKAGYESKSKMFRLFCLSFHHFDDPTARRVLKSTLETSDAFAIIELQDRRIGSLFLMLLEFWLLLAITVLWFWHDQLHLLLTYGLPILPFVHSFDGFVSCLRTRTFDETLRLVEDVQGVQSNMHGNDSNGNVTQRKSWQFSHVRALHTWPLGYMEVTFGRRD